MLFDRQIELVGKLEGRYMGERVDMNEYSIFLCGGKSTKQLSFRDRLKASIQERKSHYTYRVYYPEGLFSDMLHGHDGRDLLSLENVLAKSVSAVVIVVESAGSLVELGAFSNHELLSKKLIVLLNLKYKKDKSFVNLGPIRNLQKKETGKVMYVDFNNVDWGALSNSVCDAVRNVSQTSPVVKSLLNPIYSAKFYLALIYCFEPIGRLQVVNFVDGISPPGTSSSDSVDTAIYSLVNNGYVLNEGGRLVVTKSGNHFLLKDAFTSKKSKEIIRFLSTIRMDFLNLTLRKKNFLKRSA